MFNTCWSMTHAHDLLWFLLFATGPHRGVGCYHMLGNLCQLNQKPRIPNFKEQGRVMSELVHEKGVNIMKIVSRFLGLSNLVKLTEAEGLERSRLNNANMWGHCSFSLGKRTNVTCKDWLKVPPLCLPLEVGVVRDALDALRFLCYLLDSIIAPIVQMRKLGLERRSNVSMFVELRFKFMFM